MIRRRHAAVAAAALVGTAVGLGAFTFVYAKGGSYLTTDPAACANCHIMREHYSAWLKSSHRNVAGCNDCHTPHDVVGKYAVKASNGFWHSFAFTTGWHPDPIHITEGNREVTEGACRSCHTVVTQAIDAGSAHGGRDDGSVKCTRCHYEVGHMTR